MRFQKIFSKNKNNGQFSKNRHNSEIWRGTLKYLLGVIEGHFDYKMAYPVCSRKMRKLKFVKGGGADRGRISVEKFFSKKWLFRGNFMREIDCAHLKILKKLFRGSKIEKMQFYTGAKKVAKMVILGTFFLDSKTLFFAILGGF